MEKGKAYNYDTSQKTPENGRDTSSHFSDRVLKSPGEENQYNGNPVSSEDKQDDLLEGRKSLLNNSMEGNKPVLVNSEKPLLMSVSEPPTVHVQLTSEELDFIPKGDVVTYDEVLTTLGQFGSHQKRVFVLMGLLYISGCIQMLNSVFTLAVPDHRCSIPGVDNDTWIIQNECHAKLLNLSIPLSSSSPSSYSSCYVYNLASNASVSSVASNGHHDSSVSNSSQAFGSDRNASVGDGDDVNLSGKSARTTCHRYVYDRSTYEATIATDLDLVCERSLYRSHAQMMMMVGSLVGAQFIGPLSDAFGRRPVLVLGIVGHLAVAFVLAWTSSFTMLMVLQFCLGFSIPSILCTSFVVCMEQVGPAQRKWAGYGLMMAWSVGMVLLAPLAFAMRDWHYLQLTTSLLIIPLLSYWWLVPESPRWLLSQGRREEAEANILKTAHVNGVSLPADMLSRVRIQDKAGISILKACTSPALIARNIIILLSWVVNSLAYYGLSWNVGTLGGSVYVNFLLSGVMELVALSFCLFLLDRVGRRSLSCGLMMLAGITCTATIFPVLYAPPSSQWITVVLAMIGKMGISGSFGTLWVYTSELFPTVLRNSGLGTSSMCARVGGIIAPYIANLGDTLGGDAATAVPLVIFGVSSIVVGLLMLLLPETLGVPLPETIQDAINMIKKNKDLKNTTSS